MRDLNEIECFVRAVELKSLTAAAKALGLPKSSVSRKIRSLEGRLGMTLLIRTTRALNLTDAGRSFFERSSLALKEIDTAEDALDGSKQVVEGTLRVTAPVEFATGPFNELVASFMAEYPKIKIDCLLTERVVDLISEGYDLAFRIGELKDSTLIAKKLSLFDAQIMGTPQYFKKNGLPKTIAELENHEFIVFSPGGSPLKWNLNGPGGRRVFLPNGRLSVNHALALKEAVMRGLGLAFLPTYMVAEEIRDKKMRIVCQEWKAVGAPLHLVFPGQKFVSPKMRAFIDHVTQHLSF
jgi:DNA-binding transcriptional LysR family regulator